VTGERVRPVVNPGGRALIALLAMGVVLIMMSVELDAGPPEPSAVGAGGAGGTRGHVYGDHPATYVDDHHRHKPSGALQHAGVTHRRGR